MLRRWTELAILMLLPACGFGCMQHAHQAGTLRMAMESDASTLDPARSYDTSSIPWVRLIYRGLVEYDQQANIVNEVARERKISPDGKTYWFRLRHDVYFESGRRVVAGDFRYALDRVLDPETVSDGLALPGYLNIVGATTYTDAVTKVNKAIEAAASEGARQQRKQEKQGLHVSGIEVNGDDEIAFHLKHPDATFYNYLALPFAYAIPHETVEKWGKSFSEHPNGCGPFMLEQWVHDAWIHLKRNPRYFNHDLPKCERIEVQMGNTPTLRTMRFEQGDLDVLGISDVPPPDFIRLAHSRQWQPDLLHAPMMDVRYVGLNTELPPFDKVPVRQAMNYAIDRARIVGFMAGRGTLAHGALPPGMPGYNPHLFSYPYNPAKAKALLQQAGYKDDPANPTVLWFSNESWYEKGAQVIKEDLKQVGFSVDIKQVRYPELKAQAGKRKNIKMSIIGWIQDFPDPSNFLDILFNAKGITESASQNRAFYSNPKVNKLLDAAAVELNRPQRLRMYQDAEKIIVADAPWVFLLHTERYVIHQPWVTGYVMDPMWSERLEFVGVNP